MSLIGRCARNSFTRRRHREMYTSLFHRLGRKKTRNLQTNKHQEIEKNNYLSNSKQVNAVARNHASQSAYMPLLAIGLSNFA